MTSVDVTNVTNGDKRSGRIGSTMASTAFNNAEKRSFTKGGAPGPGRPPGAKNKLTIEGALAAREAFGPINAKVRELMERHVDFHIAAQRAAVALLEQDGASAENVIEAVTAAMQNGDCPTCRHILALSSEYTFGKPTQPHVVSSDAQSAWAADLAERYGITPDEVMRRAEEKRAKLTLVPRAG